MAAVSIVVVNHNSGSLLKTCIESVLASDIPVEIIVIDNASKDLLEKITAEHSQKGRTFPTSMAGEADQTKSNSNLTHGLRFGTR